MRMSSRAFITFTVLLGIATLPDSPRTFASTSFGIGKDEVTDLPDAICRLRKKDRISSFCSGTLTRRGNTTALATAAHCLVTQERPQAVASDLEDILVECGCDRHQCSERFKVNTDHLPEIRFEGGTTHDALMDSALLFLKKRARSTQPLRMGAYEDFIDPNTGTLREGVNCIKGGYGLDWTQTTSQFAHAFSVPRLQEVRSPKDSFVEQVVGVVYELDMPLRFRYRKVPEYLPTLVTRGQIPNTLQPGDSGSGLLCRHKGKPYTVVAVYESVAVLERKESPGFRYVINHFALLPKDLREGN